MGIRFMLGVALFATAPRVVRAEDAKPTHTLRPPADVTWMSFTPDSKQLLTGGEAAPIRGDENNYELRLWSVASGGLVAASPKASRVGASGNALALSPDGSALAVAFSRRGGGVTRPAAEVQLWSMPAKE